MEFRIARCESDAYLMKRNILLRKKNELLTNTEHRKQGLNYNMVIIFKQYLIDLEEKNLSQMESKHEIVYLIQ